MTSRTHTFPATAVSFVRYLFVILLAMSLVGPFAGGAVAADGATDAQLVIDEPHYLDGQVDQRSTNGTTLYIAEGSTLELYPQNFDTEDVVNYGVATPNATLSLNRQTGTFTLESKGAGTYEVFFVTERTIQVERPVNTTANNTTATATETVTRQQRYTARVRVDGGTNLVHQPQSEVSGLRTAAANWREFNSTMHERDLVGPQGIEKATEEAISIYELRKHPQEALTGGVVVYLVMGVTSTAILVWVVFFGGHAVITRQLRKRLNIFEAVEAEEGTAKEAHAELDRQQKQRSAQNTDWQDIDGFDDHVAGAFREMFGETVHDGTVEYLSTALPRNVVRDRLQAMGHDGYVAVVDERAAPDGGDDETGQPTSVHLAHEDNDEVIATPDEDLVRPHEADSQTLTAVRDALDTWDDPLLQRFELPEADYDARELTTTYESMDLDSVVEAVQADMRHFEDTEAFGEYLWEFLKSVEESPVCDDEGRPDEIRWVFSHFLKHAQLLDDRFDFPMMHYYREAIERALEDFDPEAEAREIIDRVQAGGAS